MASDPDQPEDEASERDDDAATGDARAASEPSPGEDSAASATDASAPAPLRKKKKKKKKVAVRRRDDEFEDEEALPPEPAPLPPVPKTEEGLNAPSRWTMVSIGLLAAATLGMWSSARLACNVHTGETKRPREIKLEELAHEPNDAALELAQRWNTFDFEGAAELAQGDLATRLGAEVQRCKADASCKKLETELSPRLAAGDFGFSGFFTGIANGLGKHRQSRDVSQRAFATTALLTRSAKAAIVRVQMLEGGSVKPGAYLLRLERGDTMWKGVSFDPDTGSVPTLPDALPRPGALAPAPAGSPVAPSASSAAPLGSSAAPPNSAAPRASAAPSVP